MLDNQPFIGQIYLQMLTNAGIFGQEDEKTRKK